MFFRSNKKSSPPRIEISVIIPALNEEELIVHLLEDLSQQTYKNFEVIVADAGSTDKTPQLAKKYGAKVVKGGIPSKGRNAGAKIAKGQYLLFVDADTRLPRDFLQNIHRIFTVQNADMILMPVTPTKFTYENYGQGWNILAKLVSPLWGGFYSLMRLLQKPLIGVGIIAVRYDVYKEHNGFNENITYAEDRDFIKRVEHSGKKIAFYPKNIKTSARRITNTKRVLASLLILTPLVAGAWFISKILKKRSLQSKLINKGMSKFYGPLGGKPKKLKK